MDGHPYLCLSFAAFHGLLFRENRLNERQIHGQNGRSRSTKVADAVSYAEQHGEYSAKGNWLTNFDKDDKAVLEAAGLEVEPDFYHQAREKFKILHIVISYLVFFVVVWFHLRHGFAAVFQTFGLYNYKYSRTIEVLGQIYTWVVCLMFTVVVLGVYFGI